MSPSLCFRVIIVKARRALADHQECELLTGRKGASRIALQHYPGTVMMWIRVSTSAMRVVILGYKTRVHRAWDWTI